MARAGEPDPGSLDAWLVLVAAEADRSRRDSEGIRGTVTKQLGRLRTVRRVYADLGVRDATLLILRELRR